MVTPGNYNGLFAQSAQPPQGYQQLTQGPGSLGAGPAMGGRLGRALGNNPQSPYAMAQNGRVAQQLPNAMAQNPLFQQAFNRMQLGSAVAGGATPGAGTPPPGSPGPTPYSSQVAPSSLSSWGTAYPGQQAPGAPPPPPPPGPGTGAAGYQPMPAAPQRQMGVGVGQSSLGAPPPPPGQGAVWSGKVASATPAAPTKGPGMWKQPNSGGAWNDIKSFL
jgi:hypothetical protein